MITKKKFLETGETLATHPSMRAMTTYAFLMMSPQPMIITSLIASYAVYKVCKKNLESEKSSGLYSSFKENIETGLGVVGIGLQSYGEVNNKPWITLAGVGLNTCLTGKMVWKYKS